MNETENKSANSMPSKKHNVGQSSLYIPFIIIGGLLMLVGLWSYFSQRAAENVVTIATEIPEQFAEVIEATPIPVVEETLPPPTETPAPTETAVPSTAVPTNTPEPTPTALPPTATPEPLPTAIPTPDPIIIELVVPRLVLRSAPSADSEPIVTLTDELSPFIGTGRNEDGSWMQIQLTDGKIGWVSSQYITSERNPFAVLPIVDPNAPAVVEEVETAVIEIEPPTETNDSTETIAQVATQETSETILIPTISILLVELNVPRLVLRERPSIDAAAIVTLTQEIFPPRALGRNPEGTWIEVLLDDGRTGWLSAEFLTVGGNPQSLPMTE